LDALRFGHFLSLSVMLPIEYERTGVPMHRSLKDQSLSVREKEVHYINPYDPLRTYTVPPSEHSKFWGVHAASHHTGPYTRTGLSTQSTRDMGVIMSYNNTTHLDATTANEPMPTELKLDTIRRFPNVVQFDDLVNDPIPQADDTPTYTQGQLIELSNESHGTYQEKENTPNKELRIMKK
jgi:hypothetical protein